MSRWGPGQSQCRHAVRLALVTVALSALPPGALRAASMFGTPLDLSGNVGYTYRSLTGSDAGDTLSQQGRVSLQGHGYLGQPWLSGLDFGLNLTGDNSTLTDIGGVSRENNTAIVTGELGLSLLPKSRTPFRLTYRQNDSRVDTYIRHSPLNALSVAEYASRRLAMTQSYFTENGNRFQLRYDNNRWESDTSTYSDELFGGDMNLRLPKQTLTAKASYQNTDYSTLSQQSENTVLNVDHFYYPSRALRIDSMASLYGYSRTSVQPLNSTNTADSETDLAQMSSYVFYRPEDTQLSLSGGVRLLDLSGSTTGNVVEVTSAHATAGMLYQYTKNLRLDARADLTTNDSDGQSANVTQERAGALYQSDLHQVFSDASYQWYLSGAYQLRDSEIGSDNDVNARFGHDILKSWRTSQRAGWRLSLSQTLTGDSSSGDSGSSEQQRLDHSVSLSRDHNYERGTGMMQVTLSDSRAGGDADNEQQFVNFQILRNQNLTRRSRLSGNLTAQWVHQVFNETGEDDTVTTATGQINYQHSRIMGVPRLRFASDLRLSRAATDEGIDRFEWENRLDYAIGLLDTRMSWRIIELDGNNFDLLYFQATRRF